MKHPGSIVVFSHFTQVNKDLFGDANEKGLYHTKTRKEFCDTLSALEKKWNAEEGEVRKRLKLSPAPQICCLFSQK